jgi:hypothetical protein
MGRRETVFSYLTHMMDIERLISTTSSIYYKTWAVDVNKLWITLIILPVSPLLMSLPGFQSPTVLLHKA